MVEQWPFWIHQPYGVFIMPPSRSTISLTADVDEWSRRLYRAFDDASRQMTNEMELREHVHPLVVQAMAELFGRNTTSAERRAARTSRQKYDRLYGGVAVEWEWAMDTARREHGADQALNYLQLIRSDQHAPEAFTAVVADGRQWGFLIVDPGQVGSDLFAAAPDTRAGYFVWRSNSPAACRQFLELIGSHQQSPVTANVLMQTFGPASELAHRVVAVLAQTLASRAERDRADTLYHEWRRALDVVYGNLDQAEGRLARVVEDTYNVPIARSVGELLYVLHTYFALVARLIAVELLATASNDPEARPTTWRGLDDRRLLDRLAGLDKGELPGGLEISNLFESDVFSWWIKPAEGNVDLLGSIRELLAAMSGLAFPRVVYGPSPAIDILRDLYQSLVPRELRRALGEFLTPTWLAQACLERLTRSGANLAEARILDPTCGTGTFLLPLLTHRLRRLQTERGTPTASEVQTVLNSVCGVDLNPVAITAARVNYVIALGDLASAGPITLPLWRADSLLVPDAPPAQGTLGRLEGLSYREIGTSLPDSFPIPLTLARADRLAILRALMDTFLPSEPQPGQPTPNIDTLRDEFLTALDREFAPGGRSPSTTNQAEWDNDRAVAAALFEQLSSLAVVGRDGVWIQIIENAFAPLFAGKFNVVVGNPPWLTWTRLPDEWRNASQRVWQRYGLWRVPAEPGAPFSLASTDLATLVFAVALDRYISDDGWVGLLTPDSLLIGDPGGRAFRKFRLRADRRDQPHSEVDIRFAIVHVDNWSRVRPFAPEAVNRPLFLTARRAQKQSAATPGVQWERVSRGVLGPTWNDAQRLLRSTGGEYRPVDPSTLTSAWSFQVAGAPPLIEGGSNSWEFGKGLDTRGANGIYFVRIVQADRARKQVVIENLPDQGRNREVQRTRGTVESTLVYPLLRGRDVQPWIAKPSVYFVLPHRPDDLAQVIEDGEMNRDYPGARRWLRRHFETLRRRSAPPTRSWQIEGDDWCRVDGPLQYMSGSHLVVVRELQARPAAALAEARMDYDLGRITTPLIDHKLLFCSVPTLAEALYLIGMINSTPIQDLLASYANQIAVSPTTLRRLPIPAYDSGREDITRLVEVANSIITAENTAQQAIGLQSALDEAALRVLDVQDYRAQPRRQSARRSRNRAPANGDSTLF